MMFWLLCVFSLLGSECLVLSGFNAIAIVAIFFAPLGNENKAEHASQRPKVNSNWINNKEQHNDMQNICPPTYSSSDDT